MTRVGYYNEQDLLCCWRDCRNRSEAIAFCDLFNGRLKHMRARIIEEESTGQNTFGRVGWPISTVYTLPNRL